MRRLMVCVCVCVCVCERAESSAYVLRLAVSLPFLPSSTSFAADSHIQVWCCRGFCGVRRLLWAGRALFGSHRSMKSPV